MIRAVKLLCGVAMATHTFTHLSKRRERVTLSVNLHVLDTGPSGIINGPHKSKTVIGDVFCGVGRGLCKCGNCNFCSIFP